MLERIDLFMPPSSRYGVLHYFTKCLAQALSRCGIRTRVLEAERDNPKAFLDTIFSDKPECTISFNGLLPDQEGRFFCDLIQIPHVACLVDAPHHFVSLTRSPYSIITTVDRSARDFFQQVKFNNVLFMPHAVPKEQMVKRTKVNESRPIDVLCIASFIDFEEIAARWKKKLPKPLAESLHETAELALRDRTTPYMQFFVKNLDRISREHPSIDVKSFNHLELLDDLEDYINGKERIELAKAVGDTPLHIFGVGSDHWLKYKPPQARWTIHEAVEYEKIPELISRSKLLLNSCASIKQGGHERLFTGIARGAVVLTNRNGYTQEEFKHNENILMFEYGELDEVENLIKSYLNDPKKQLDLVQQGQELIEAYHTWDHRAALLANELSPILGL